MPKHNGQYQEAIVQVVHELESAAEQYGEFQSIHEGVGVLQEEVYELWDAIRSDDIDHIYLEAKQVAAMSVKLMRLIEVINSVEIAMTTEARFQK